MQPYFLPYIGYFQLMAAVDKLVLLDTVTYIKGGWVNRNRLLVADSVKWLTLPLLHSSSNKRICDLEIASDELWKKRALRTIEQSYAKSPHAGRWIAWSEAFFSGATGRLSEFLHATLVSLRDHFELDCEIVATDEHYDTGGLVGVDRLISICRQENADTYVNSIGGQSLYSREQFKSCGIDLCFLQATIPDLEIRGQATGDLSILHLLMHMEVDAVSELCKTVRYK